MEREQALSVYVPPAELMRQATDVAGVTKQIVVSTAITIQGRKYVRVEGWQAIAIAHGCCASSGEVRRTTDGNNDPSGWSAVGEVRRMSDGAVIARAEGFVGLDELKWGGGVKNGKQVEPAPEYACRAMAQTRAISRACRSAFAHVVVMIDAGLSTTPAEEVPEEGFHEAPRPAPAPRQDPAEAVTPPAAPRAPSAPPPARADEMATRAQAGFFHGLRKSLDWGEERGGAWLKEKTGVEHTSEVLKSRMTEILDELLALKNFMGGAK